MTAPTAPRPASAPASGGPADGVGAPASRTGRVRPTSFRDAMGAEWIKLRSLRSTSVTLVVAAVLAIGLAPAIAAGVAHSYHRHTLDLRTFDPVGDILGGFVLAHLAAAVLGSLAVGGEYSSGMIRTSLTAVPRRGRLLAAKALVFAVLVLVVGEISAFGAYLTGHIVYSSQSLPVPGLGAPHVVRAVIGAGLYLTLIGLLAVGVATLVRRTAGAISIVVSLIFVVPIILAVLPSSVGDPLRKYWPTVAGTDIAHVVRGDNELGAWAGFGIMVAFVAVVLALAAWRFERSDA